MTHRVLFSQAHEDPMYDIIRENKRNEKETRYVKSFSRYAHHVHVISQVKPHSFPTAIKGRARKSDT